MMKPTRTPAHAQLAELLSQFRDAGVTPIVSTNGGELGADIQIAKGPAAGDVADVWITDAGWARLRAAAVAR